MNRNFRLLIVMCCCSLIFISCSHTKKISGIANNNEIHSKIKISNKVPAVKIQTGGVTAEELVDFAETLNGIPYKYGGTSEKTGFDCSGFVWYVFSHFNIKAPRTSEGYTNAGKEIDIKDSKRGDLILFTGSDSHSGKVGHMGIITANEKNKISFLHAASGGGRGVMTSQMSQYFVERFVKVNRIFTD